MDEKDFEKEINDQEPENSTPSNNDVTYEDNDNWEFDGEAATLNDDLFESDSDDDVADIIKKIEEAVSENQENTKKNKDNIVISKKALKIIPLVIVLVAAIGVAGFFGYKYFAEPRVSEGKHMNPGSVVATVNGDKVSAGMYNYYYSSIVGYYEQYAAYGYFSLNTEKPYDEQTTTDADGNTVTWEEFFRNKTLEEIEYTNIFYNKGLEAGVELTDAQKETIEDQIDSLQAAASEEKITADEYAQKQFGKFCGIDTIKLMLEQYYITANYRGMYATQTNYSDKEIDKYLTKHENDYKSITFSYLAMDYDATSDDTKKESEDLAKKYLSQVTDKKSVINLVPTVYEKYIKEDAKSMMDSDESLTESAALKKSTENYKDTTEYTLSFDESPFDAKTTEWLFSDDTKIGEKTYYINEETGYIYILLKTELASMDDSLTYNVRHILIAPEQDETSTTDEATGKVTYTDAQWKAAKEKAEKLLKEFNDSKGKEYDFALLAEENSTDTGSISASGTTDVFGGLYEGVKEGDMVPEFEKWALDSSRKYGDTGIVKTDFGYHIIFFISTDKSFRASAKTDMRAAELQEIVDDADVKIHESRIEKALEAYEAAKLEQQQQESADTDSEETAQDDDSQIVLDDEE